MTYAFNDQAIFESVPGAKAIVRRPIGMSEKKWAKYADGVVKALDNRAPCTPLERGEAIHKAMLDDAREPLSMKLVDILARELKVWPESWGIFCVATKVEGNDAAWFNHRNPVFKDGGWQDLGSVELWLSQEPEDRKQVVVRRFEWQAAVDALNAPKAYCRVDLSSMIHAGWLDAIWPRNTYSIERAPGLAYVQSIGRCTRKLVVDPKPEPKTDSQENKKFLEARVKLLEAELAELREEAKVKPMIGITIDDNLLAVMSAGHTVSIEVNGYKVALIREKT